MKSIPYASCLGRLTKWRIAPRLLASIISQPALAAYEAVSFYAGIGIAGYARGGAGFGFMPKSDIVVTWLGYDARALVQGSCLVTLWHADGKKLTSSLITSNSSYVNWSRYEPIAPIILRANETYYLQGLYPPEYWVGEGALDCFLQLGPKISYLGVAVGTNGNGIFPRDFGTEGVFFAGANFLYEVPPFVLIKTFEIANGTGALTVQTSSDYSGSLTLLQSEQPGGPWRIYSEATLVTNSLAGSYTFSVPLAQPSCFYSVQIP